jgi:hypothetical protein
MKKVFEELDGLIPRSLLDRWPEKRKLIRKIDKIENLIDEYCSNKRRALLYQNCEGNQKQKLLRIYLDHKYANQTSEEKGHYLLTIQGRLIDSAIYQHFSFGLFFDSIKVVLDKKHNPNNCVYEWNKSAFATGSQSNCFRFKIFSENRHLPIKIILQRSAYSKQRYEVSAELRSLFPQIRQDPTEDEVMDALFQYITTNQLLEAKEKAAVKCDQVRIECIHENSHLFATPFKYISHICAYSRRHCKRRSVHLRPTPLPHPCNPCTCQCTPFDRGWWIAFARATPSRWSMSCTRGGGRRASRGTKKANTWIETKTETRTGENRKAGREAGRQGCVWCCAVYEMTMHTNTHTLVLCIHLITRPPLPGGQSSLTPFLLRRTERTSTWRCRWRMRGATRWWPGPAWLPSRGGAETRELTMKGWPRR